MLGMTNEGMVRLVAAANDSGPSQHRTPGRRRRVQQRNGQEAQGVMLKRERRCAA